MRAQFLRTVPIVVFPNHEQMPPLRTVSPREKNRQQLQPRFPHPRVRGKVAP